MHDKMTATPGHQVWVRTRIWYPRKVRLYMPLNVLLGTGAGGASYTQLHLYKVLGVWRFRSSPLHRDGGGRLEAAYLSYSHLLLMYIVGFTVLSPVFHPEHRIRNVSLHLVQELPYGYIFGAASFRVNRSLLSIAENEGF